MWTRQYNGTNERADEAIFCTSYGHLSHGETVGEQSGKDTKEKNYRWRNKYETGVEGRSYPTALQGQIPEQNLLKQGPQRWTLKFSCFLLWEKAGRQSSISSILNEEQFAVLILWLLSF